MIIADLTQKHCEPCEGGVDPFTPEEIEKYNSVLSTPWQVLDNKKITREFKFKNFTEAMQFVNSVAKLAQSEGHHPDIYIFYNKVKLELWTHAIGGLSINDFILAAKIESNV
ncbi:MAG: 4a-hydroxytetrahydrobiopterin dehydratase [Candidatus Roizmanbacteria bacterium]|nr:4a-hydroxytetrahydrobiopterin dehydratase [Candidatus Roizmanbacteria bacterium]